MRKLLLFAILATGMAQAQVSKGFEQYAKASAAVRPAPRTNINVSSSAIAIAGSPAVAADLGFDWKTEHPWRTMKAEGKHVLNFRGKEDLDVFDAAYLDDAVKVDTIASTIIYEGKSTGNLYKFKYEVYKDNLILNVKSIKLKKNNFKDVYAEGKRAMPRKVYQHLRNSINYIANLIK